MKKISEQEAWLECAEWCAQRNANDPRSPRAYLCHRLSDAMGWHSDPGFDSVPSHWPHKKMLKRLQNYCYVADNWSLTDDEGSKRKCLRNDSRVVFSVLMALEIGA